MAYGNLVRSSESGGNTRVPGYSAFGTARPYGSLVRSPSQQILTKSSACRTAFRTQYKREVRGLLGVTFRQKFELTTDFLEYLKEAGQVHSTDLGIGNNDFYVPRIFPGTIIFQV